MGGGEAHKPFRVFGEYTKEFSFRVQSHGMLFNLYQTRGGARGQATMFVNQFRAGGSGQMMYSALRIEELIDGVWTEIERREV